MLSWEGDVKEGKERRVRKSDDVKEHEEKNGRNWKVKIKKREKDR